MQPVYVQMPPNQQMSVNAPLLSNQHNVVAYPVYHPGRVVVYAKKSRSNCCCVIGSLCCCCFLFLGLIIGAAVGIVAWQFTQMDNQTTEVYSIDASSTSTFIINAEHGDITFVQAADGFPNVTVTVERRASKYDLLASFSTSLTLSNGAIIFSDQSTSNNWESFLGSLCMSVEITISIPANNNESIQVTQTNGDIDFSSIYLMFNSLDLTSQNGDISVSGVNSTTISATSTNGDISFTDVSSDSITLKTTNGDISLNNYDVESLLEENYSMETTNGDVTFTLMGFIGDFSLSTSNGNVDVYYYGLTQVNFTSQSSTNAQGYVGNVGMGGNVQASSVNGDVTATFDSYM